MPKVKQPIVCQSKTADKHVLYQEAVQNPKTEVKFIDKVYRLENGRKPILLREDFCGTAYLCAHWLQTSPERRAIGVDIDRSTLVWGKENNFSSFEGTEKRFRLFCKNVLDIEENIAKSDSPDVICAYNFALFFFETRKDLIKYLKIVYNNLKRDGIFIFDVLGGESIQQDGKSTKKLSGDVIYEFSHTGIDPITNFLNIDITFKFKDGSKLKSCFTYKWRIWSITDLREAVEEAGFKRTTVWFPQQDDDDADVHYEPTSTAEQRDSWNCYVVCTK